MKLPKDVYGSPAAGTGNGTWKCVIFSGTQDEHDDMVEALRLNGISFKAGEPFYMPEPPTRSETGEPDTSLPVVIEGMVSETHRRAHAKIFLNTVARYLGCDEAMKPHWGFLRRYVRYGEGVIRYRVLDHSLRADEKALRHLIGGTIVVLIENRGDQVVGTIRFYGNQSYQYVLREKESMPESQVFGYLFTDGEVPAPMVKAKAADL